MEDSEAPPVALSEAATRAESSPLNILVVEDDDASRTALIRILQLSGYVCRGAANGLEALAIIHQGRPDIVLADWAMPYLDGLDLCRRLRSMDSAGAYTYFIYVTAFLDQDHYRRGLEAGADDYLRKPVDLDDLRARLASARRVIGVHRSLVRQNAALKRDSQAALSAARIDSLTELANRRALDEDLKAVFAHVARYHRTYSVGIGDIDQFKAYNDRYGHLAGDELLRRIAVAIRRELRDGDGVYRYGGDEFVAILPEQLVGDAAQALNRARLAVERLAIPSAREGAVVTMSWGVATLDPSLDTSPGELLHHADLALYRAKSNGRNRVESSG